VELTSIYSTVFEHLKIPVEIRLNSRKILAALAQIAGGADKMMDITIAIDKLDKIGLDKVKEELQERGLTPAQVTIIAGYLEVANSRNNDAILSALQELFTGNETGLAGIGELQYILEQTRNLHSTNTIVLDPTLARGLNYYTGTIFEIKAIGVQMGSIGGGGRYDDLTGLFGVPNIPGVGISFGVDRIYDVMEELKLFPPTVEQGTRVLFFNLGTEESKTAYTLLQQVRKAGTAAEIFHEVQKFDKQFKYAEKKNIPYIVIIGSSEIAERTAMVKDLRSGQQQKVSFEELPQYAFA
jgi:histidyl-tRNA synthetase